MPPAGRALVALLWGVATLSGCRDKAGPNPGEAASRGDTLVFAAPPERVVSLVPSVTRILLALGAGEVLVGRTDYDTLPDVADLPSVGGGLQPDLERLLTLEPDLVIRFAGEQDPVTPRALRERGVPQLAVRPDGINDVRAIVRRLGRVMGREDEAAALLADLDDSLAGVRARVADRDRVRVAYVLGGDPPWVAGPGTYVADLLEAAGAENVFADLERLYAPVSLEELLARDVDVFVVSRGTAVSPLLERRAPVREVSADIESPGLGLGESASELARLLHPEAFR